MTIWLTALAACPEPAGPRWVIERLNSRAAAAPSATASSVPPQKTVSCRAPRPRGRRRPGRRRSGRAARSSSAASLAETLGETVEQSTSTAPRPWHRQMPPAEHDLLEVGPSDTQVRTRSAPDGGLARRVGARARRAPRAAPRGCGCGCARVTVSPALRGAAPSGAPIVPSPTTPTRISGAGLADLGEVDHGHEVVLAILAVVEAAQERR